MGTLDIQKEYQPFSMVPPGALPNALTEVAPHYDVQKQAMQPVHLTFTSPHDSTVAGIWEVSGQEFLQGKQRFFPNNAQIVSIPERPVDAGTFWPIAHKEKLQYNQPSRGIANQAMATWSAKAVAGSAPYQGVYTGLNSYSSSILSGDEGS